MTILDPIGPDGRLGNVSSPGQVTAAGRIEEFSGLSSGRLCGSPIGHARPAPTDAVPWTWRREFRTRVESADGRPVEQVLRDDDIRKGDYCPSVRVDVLHPFSLQQIIWSRPSRSHPNDVERLICFRFPSDVELTYRRAR